MNKQKLLILIAMFSFLGVESFLLGIAQPQKVQVAKTTQVTDRHEMSNPGVLIGKLYRGGNAAELFDFTAEFRVKKNLSGKDTKDPSDLQNFIQGKIYFKAPNKLRVDSSFATHAMLNSEQFVLIRDGTTEWLFKNGMDYPMKKRSDTQESSSYLPFRFQLYDGGDWEYVFLGQENKEGRLIYVIGIVSDKDPDREIKKVWVDAQYLVPVKLQYKVEKWVSVRENMIIQNDEVVVVKKKKQITVEQVYKNIRQTSDGRWIPTQMELYQNGTLMQVVYYDKVGVNFQLPDTLFAPQQNSSSMLQ